jgi:hypothetical protein
MLILSSLLRPRNAVVMFLPFLMVTLTGCDTQNFYDTGKFVKGYRCEESVCRETCFTVFKGSIIESAECPSL